MVAIGAWGGGGEGGQLGDLGRSWPGLAELLELVESLFFIVDQSRDRMSGAGFVYSARTEFDW